jgi:hypothetical protein
MKPHYRTANAASVLRFIQDCIKRFLLLNCLGVLFFCKDTRLPHIIAYFTEQFRRNDYRKTSMAISPSSPGEFHPQALTDPYVTVSRHTARAILPLSQRLGLTPRLLPSLVGQTVRPDDPTPSLHPHYRDFNATMGQSAPVSRIGTLASWGVPT